MVYMMHQIIAFLIMTISYYFVGVTATEIILSKITSFFVLMLIQIAPTFFVIIYGFDVSYHVICMNGQ